jgi:hypothetical protein
MIMLLSTTGTSARFSRSVGRAMLAGAEAVRTLLKRRRTYGSLSKSLAWRCVNPKRLALTSGSIAYRR